jgi:hypothetical protein
MISYKHYDINNFSELFENKGYLQEIFKIKNNETKAPKNYADLLRIYLLSDLQNAHLFLILKDGKPVGFNQGRIFNNTYHSENQFV